MEIAFVLLALIFLILWFVIGSKGKWWLKAVVIAMSLHVCLSISYSLPDFAGWPSRTPLPPKFLVHWMVVKEPVKETKAAGAIYVWATSLSTDTSPQHKETGLSKFLFSLVDVDKSQPRVYELPYSTPDHETANGVIGRIKNGETVIGESGGQGTESGKGSGQGNEEGSDNKGEGKGGFSLSDDVTFQNLPPPILPPKD